jgi:hypothetical protein
MYGRLHRRSSVEFKERTEADATMILEMELNKLRVNGKLEQHTDKAVGQAFKRFKELFEIYLVQEGPGIVFITLNKYIMLVTYAGYAFLAGTALLHLPHLSANNYAKLINFGEFGHTLTPIVKCDEQKSRSRRQPTDGQNWTSATGKITIHNQHKFK